MDKRVSQLLQSSACLPAIRPSPSRYTSSRSHCACSPPTTLCIHAIHVARFHFPSHVPSISSTSPSTSPPSPPPLPPFPSISTNPLYFLLFLSNSPLSSTFPSTSSSICPSTLPSNSTSPSPSSFTSNSRSTSSSASTFLPSPPVLLSSPLPRCPPPPPSHPHSPPSPRPLLLPRSISSSDTSTLPYTSSSSKSTSFSTSTSTSPPSLPPPPLPHTLPPYLLLRRLHVDVPLGAPRQQPPARFCALEEHAARPAGRASLCRRMHTQHTRRCFLPEGAGPDACSSR